MLKRTMSGQQWHVASVHSFIVSVVLDNYQTYSDYPYPFPSLGSFCARLQAQHVITLYPYSQYSELEAIILHKIDIYASAFLGSYFIQYFLPQIWQGNVNWIPVQWFLFFYFFKHVPSPKNTCKQFRIRRCEWRTPNRIANYKGSSIVFRYPWEPYS